VAGAYAWKSWGDAGARLAFGSAAPLSPPDPFAAIAAAITRTDAQEQPFGGWQPQERLTREGAFAALTAGAAWAGFADGRFGRLAQGQRADFLFLDRDPLLANPAELRATRVLETWVGGRQVYRAKEAPTPPAPNGETGR
jgi:predicted amidohydrolase YtcJ